MGRRGVLRGLCDKHPEVYCRLIKEDSTFVCVKCTSSELVKDLSSLTKNSYPWQSEASTFAEKKERFATLFEKMNLNKKSENISRSQQLFYKTKTTDTTNATIEGGSSSTDFKSALENLKSIKKDMDVRMYNYNNKKNDLLDEVRARRASNLKTKEKIIKYDEVDIGSKDNKIKSSTFKGSYDEFSANETAGTGGVMIPSDDAAGTRKRIQLFERTNVREDDLLQELMSNSSMSQMDDDTQDLLSLSMSNFLFLEQDLKDNSKMKYLLKAFQKEEFAAGATIIAQGEPGSKLYILDCGTVEIFINNEFVREMNRGAIFGELALLYDAPRSATVRCKAGYETVVLWSLNRAIFKQIQIESSSNVQMQRSRWLVNCKDLAVLGAIDLQRLVSSLQVLELAADTKVYTMNQLSDEVIIIEKGFVSIYASESLRGKSLEDIDAALGIIRPPGSPKYVFEENAMYARTLVAEATREGHPSSSIPAVHVCDVMEGCILGLNILRGKAGLPESWPWIKAEVGDAEGAVVPFTAVAGSDVNVLIFSVDTFERLVGAASDIFLSPVFSLKKAALIRQENNDIIALNCQKFDVANFTIKYILGCGSFGCVAFAEYTEPRQQAKRPSLRNSFSNFMSAAAGGNVSQRQEPKPVVEKISSYALKLFSKSEIVRTRQVDQIITEKKLLSMLRNRFILRVYGTAQSSNHLYIVTEVLDCGDLWELIYLKNPSPHQGLPLELTRFYAASIILGLGYIHEKGLAHRDIKPENIMLDKKGYLRIIDFGFCKMIPFTTTSPTGQERIHAKSFTLCGTPEYLAPEVIAHAGHDHSVDLWAVGILVYEMFMVTTPFASASKNNVKEIFSKITRSKKNGLNLRKSMDSRAGNDLAQNLVTALVQFEPSMRLGMSQGSTRVILTHEFFAGFDVAALEAGTLEPVYIHPPITQHDTTLKMPPVKPYKGNQSLFVMF